MYAVDELKDKKDGTIISCHVPYTTADHIACNIKSRPARLPDGFVSILIFNPALLPGNIAIYAGQIILNIAYLQINQSFLITWINKIYLIPVMELNLDITYSLTGAEKGTYTRCSSFC